MWHKNILTAKNKLILIIFKLKKNHTQTKLHEIIFKIVTSVLIEVHTLITIIETNDLDLLT